MKILEKYTRMSLNKNFVGRKRDSVVWDWFEYNIGTDSCRCLVVDDKSEKECTAKELHRERILQT